MTAPHPPRATRPPAAAGIRTGAGPVTLRPPALADRDAVLAAHDDLARTDGFPFLLGWQPDADWAAFVHAAAVDHPAGRSLPDGWVPHTFLVAVSGPTVLGRLSLRHSLTEHLATWGGHLGYGVLAAHRRRGVATAILQLGLRRAAALGLPAVLVTCDEANVGSATVIERCGGRFDGHAPPTAEYPCTRRYWVPTAG